MTGWNCQAGGRPLQGPSPILCEQPDGTALPQPDRPVTNVMPRNSLAVASGSPLVGEREIVMVSLVVLVQLPDAGESRALVAELCAAALSEPRSVAFQRQLPAVEPDRVDPMDAARVEVLHREVVLALHHADHAERVGKVGVVVDRTLDQEPATFKPLVGGLPANHRVFDHRV